MLSLYRQAASGRAAARTDRLWPAGNLLRVPTANPKRLTRGRDFIHWAGHNSARICRFCNQPKFEFVINLKTAKTPGIRFSENVPSLADDVIE
jgi:hypothetical protein